MPNATAVIHPVERALFLRTLPLLQGISPASVAALAGVTQEVVRPAGEVLGSGKELQETAYIIVRGRVRASHGDRPPRFVGPGEVAGLMHLLARTPHPVSLRAEEDTVALMFSDDDFEDVCEQHFPILARVLSHVASESLEEVARLPSGARVGLADPDEGGPPAAPRLDFVERIAALGSSPAFPAASMDSLSELARHVTEARRAAGDELWRPGDPAKHFELVVSGAVRCETGAGWHYHGGRGATVGEYEALAPVDRRFRAIAQEPLLTLRIEIEPFLDILEDHFAMAMEFLSVLARDRLDLASRS